MNPLLKEIRHNPLLFAGDWPEVPRRYQAQLAQVETADAFYVLLFHLVNELKDTHSWLQNYTPPRPAQGPGLAVDLFGASRS